MGKGMEVSPLVVGIIVAVVLGLAVVAVWRLTSGPGKVVMSQEKIQAMKEAMNHSHPPVGMRPMGPR